MAVLSRIKNKITLSTVELLLITFLLVFGSLTVLMTPLGAGYDEEQHLKRVWQISKGYLIPKDLAAQVARFPKIYIDLSYRREPLVESVGFDYWQKYAQIGLYGRGINYGPLSTRSNYLPLLYLPHALTMRFLGIRWELPALTVFYATRFAGLFAYAVLAWLSLRAVPYGKWIILVLCLSPMAIYQASTINADTISNGIGILFICGTLYIHEKQNINWKTWTGLVILIALLFLTKPNLFPLILLPFLLIKPSRFPKRISYFLLLFLTLSLFMIEVVGWWNISSSTAFADVSGVNPVEQVKYLFSNPFSVFRILSYSFFSQAPRYIQQWIGVFGYDYGSPPSITYIAFLLSLGAALLVRTEINQPDKKTRIILLLVFLASYISTELILYITFTEVGEAFVYGVQGRYLIPIFPLLFLALTNPPILRKIEINAPYKVALVLTTLLTFIAGLILTYHVTCGPSYYNRGLCYQPFYKNFSPLSRSSPPISGGTTLVQEIYPVCDGMNMIQVRVNSPGNDANGSVQFSLFDVEQDNYVVEQTVKSNALPDDDWYSLYFNPDWESAHKQFKLTIRGVDTELNVAPLLAYSIRPEYPSGELFVNGIAVEDDVIFRYGCISGLDKILYKPAR